MIRIAANAIEVYTSDEYSHPNISGLNKVPYYLNHGLSAYPNLVKVYRKASVTGGDVWIVVEDFYAHSSSVFYSMGTMTPADTATVYVDVYRLGSGITIRFQAFVIT